MRRRIRTLVSAFGMMLALTAAPRVRAQGAASQTAAPQTAAPVPTTQAAPTTQTAPTTAPPAEPPPPSTPPPALTGTQPPATTEPKAPARPASDGKRASETLRAFADNEHSSRINGAYALLIVGAASAAAGLLADLEYDQSYGEPLWIAGAVAGVAAVVALLTPGQLERFAATSGSQSPDALHREWEARAHAAKSARQISGVVSLGLGALAAGAGAAIAAGAGDMSEGAKQDWSVGLILGGGAIMGSGLASILVESHTELGYRAAYGESPDAHPPVVLGAAALPGGGAVSLGGSF